MEAPRLLLPDWQIRLGYKGSLDIWPRYAFCKAYRVAPRLSGFPCPWLPLSRFRGFGLGSAQVPKAFIGLSYISRLAYANLPPPPGAISAPFGTRPRWIRHIAAPLRVYRAPRPLVFCSYLGTISASPTFVV